MSNITPLGPDRGEPLRPLPNVADLIGVATRQPCPQCRHPEVTTLLDQGETPKTLAVYCRRCMWTRGAHLLVREYMEHCGHRFGIVCAACGLETGLDYIEVSKGAWKRVGWAWICPDHLTDLYKAALNELLDTLAEGRLP